MQAPRSVTIHLFDNLSLTVTDFQRPFSTFYDAQSATVTFFLIDFYNISRCHNAPPLYILAIVRNGSTPFGGGALI